MQVGLGVCGESGESDGRKPGAEPTLGQIQLETNSQTTRSVERKQQLSAESKNPLTPPHIRGLMKKNVMEKRAKRTLCGLTFLSFFVLFLVLVWLIP